MTPEQAKFTAQFFVQGLENEFGITKKVIAAVPEAKKSYRPDEHARTAFELASHIASVDVWFLNGIAKGDLTPEGDKRFNTVAEIVAYYDREFPAALAKIKAMPAEKLAQPLAAFGIFNFPAVAYLAFTNNHG
ncbi:MAG TPA: DinB family protein, partial [Candidatus Binatia bacterium]|nr:DinB family protein [Candidatus Binatia bacterium]